MPRKILNELDLLDSEQPDLLPVYPQHADNFIVFQHGHAEQCPGAGKLDGGGPQITTVSRDRPDIGLPRSYVDGLGDLSTVVGAKSTCSSALTGIAGIVGPVPQEPRVLNAGPARPWPGGHHALFVRRKGAGPGTAVAAGVHHTPRTVNFCEAGNGAAGDKQARRDETGTHHS